MPSRRACLASIAAAGLAGCVGTSPGSTPNSATDTATTATSTSSPPALVIKAVAIQYSYRHIQNVDWNAIRPADGQFVFVTVNASEMESTPSQDAFALVSADEIHDPVKINHRYPVGLDVPGGPYAPERENSGPRGWLVFDIPAQLATAPSLRLEGDTDSWEWELDTEKATTPPPAWEWSASVPETVPPDDTFNITVTAENVGDGPGTFRGAVNFSYPMYRPKGFDIVLDPGGSDEATVSASTKDADPGTGLEYGIRTPVGQSTVAVAVEPESSTTESTS